MGKISRRSYKEELKQPIIKEWVANKHLEFMFTELDPATEHDLRVFVKNTTDGREFLHAPVVSAKTRDGVPSSPVNLTAIQSGRGMILAWGWPALTKGDIQVFVIKVFQRGD